VLLLVGENDLVIPSATEGPRLQRALPRALLRILPGRSHAMLQVCVLSVLQIMVVVVVVVLLGFIQRRIGINGQGGVYTSVALHLLRRCAGGWHGSLR
jgi:hypothetical protein